jgi:hypothetical protein
VIIFIVLGLAALALLSGYDRGSGSADGIAVTGPVQIWGTMPGSGMANMIACLKSLSRIRTCLIGISHQQNLISA